MTLLTGELGGSYMFAICLIALLHGVHILYFNAHPCIHKYICTVLVLSTLVFKHLCLLGQ